MFQVKSGSPVPLAILQPCSQAPIDTTSRPFFSQEQASERARKRVFIVTVHSYNHSYNPSRSYSPQPQLQSTATATATPHYPQFAASYPSVTPFTKT
jgi:hypothetical protein